MSEPIKKQNRTNPESYNPKKPEILNLAEEVQRNMSYPESFILPDKSTTIPPEIKHYGPAYVAFGNEFSHLLDYTGQGYGFIYDGDWCKDRGYTIADILTGHAMEPAPLFFRESVQTLWTVAGFNTCRTFYADSAKGNHMSESEMKDAMKYALCTLKQPVIIPQESRWWGSIVVGYKDHGNILVIYHFFPYFMDMENNAQPKTEEIADWYNAKTSILIAGKRVKALSLAEIYRVGFRRIRDCLDLNIHGGKRRYYDEWEAFLRLNKDEMMDEVKRTGIVPGGCDGTENGKINEQITDENVWELICRAHNSTWCDVAERRFYIMNFMRQAKDFFPEIIEDLQAIDNQFWHASVIMGGNDGNGYGTEIGDPCKPQIFEKQDVRMRMADCVVRLKEADAKGLEMVEKLLERMKLK